MPEEGNAPEPEVQDTPVEETQEETPQTEAPDTPQEDYESRYKEAQAWGTRASQEASELRQANEQFQLAKSWLSSDDPDERRQAQEFLGLQVEEDDGYQPDELEQLRQQVSSLTQAQEAQQEDAFYAQLSGQIDDEIDTIAKENNATLHPMVKEQIFTRAVALDPDQEGNLQVEQAYKDVMEEMRKAFVEDYVASKKAPRVAPSGQKASQKVDMKNPESRVDAMAAMMEANSE